MEVPSCWFAEGRSNNGRCAMVRMLSTQPGVRLSSMRDCWLHYHLSTPRRAGNSCRRKDKMWKDTFTVSKDGSTCSISGDSCDLRSHLGEGGLNTRVSAWWNPNREIDKRWSEAPAELRMWCDWREEVTLEYPRVGKVCALGSRLASRRLYFVASWASAEYLFCWKVCVISLVEKLSSPLDVNNVRIWEILQMLRLPYVWVAAKDATLLESSW